MKSLLPSKLRWLICIFFMANGANGEDNLKTILSEMVLDAFRWMVLARHI